MDCIEQVSQVADSGNPDITPGIRAVSPGNGGKKERWRIEQFFRRSDKNINAPTVGSQRKQGLPEPSLNGCAMIRLCQYREAGVKNGL